MKSFLKKTIKSLKPKRKAGVKFSKQVEICEVAISDDEVRERWYNLDDYRRFREKNLARGQEMNKRMSAGNGELVFPVRGLENQHPEFREKSRIARQTCLEVVLAAQELQWTLNMHDPKAIAKEYRKLCQASKEDALFNAHRDEEYVRNVVASAA